METLLGRGVNPDPFSPENIPYKAGPPLVGIILNWWLFGILVMQYFLYCTNVAHRDHKILRIIVHVLFVLDVIQSIMTMSDAFEWFVYNYGNSDALLNFKIAAIDSPFFDALIAFVVQIVYCWRVRVLSGWRILPAIIAFLAFAGAVNGICLGVIDRVIETASNFKPDYMIPAMLWLWCSAATDVLIASSMTYLLLKLKSERTNKNVLQVMKRLVLLTLETNFITTLVAIAAVVVLLIKPIGLPYTNIYEACGYILGKLYSNSFMVLLNQRVYYESLSAQRQDMAVQRQTGSNISFPKGAGQRNSLSVGNSYSPPSTACEVTVVQFVDSPGPSPRKIKSDQAEDVELGEVKYAQM